MPTITHKQFLSLSDVVLLLGACLFAFAAGYAATQHELLRALMGLVAAFWIGWRAVRPWAPSEARWASLADRDRSAGAALASIVALTLCGLGVGLHASDLLVVGGDLVGFFLALCSWLPHPKARKWNVAWHDRPTWQKHLFPDDAPDDDRAPEPA